MIYYPEKHELTLTNATLIMPSANAIGMFGQLSIDLLIYNYKAERIGFIHSDYILPIIGRNPYHQSSLTLATAFEVYSVNIDAEKYVFMQIRSPLQKGRATQFSIELAQFIQEMSFKKVIVLTSIDSTYLRDFGGSRIGYKSFNQFPINKILLHEGKWNEVIVEKQDFEPKTRFLPPGAGCSQQIFDQFEKSGIQCLFLTCYAHDGDNTDSAIEFSKQLSLLLEFRGIDHFLIPYSWNKVDKSDFNEIY